MRTALKRTYIGIDPGTTGGIAILVPGQRFSVFPMPYRDGAYDEQTICAYLEAHENPMAIVEKVHSRPGNSARSMFGFGTGYGLLLGILAAFAIPKELVMPQRWQIAMLAGENKSDTKAASRRVAKRLFPGVNFFATSRSVIESHGMTDAALLAEYGRRMRL